MRPVQLDLDGFATFRTRAVIDFADADYFALVGPTGAGKSTVLDAITFALYGTVPRWNDQRMITPALAPTATRGVVRLIFDADGVRYAVGRDVRRSGGKTSRVTMHGSRLERLHDPDEFDGETDVLAADTEVTPAIERLLGLSYQHFTTCVALPQGRFAEFLHAKASERQDILSSLLGYQFYDELHARANEQARDHRTAIKALDASLEGYTDATAENAAERASYAQQLASLQAELADVALPALDAAAANVAEAGAAARDLVVQHSALAAVSVPDDVAELDARNADAVTAVAAAREERAEAEQADRAATDAVTGMGARFTLQTLEQQWRDLAKADDELPVLTEAAAAATIELEQAHVAIEEAESAAETLRQAADIAQGAAADAAAAVTACEQQAEALGAVAAPAGIAELADSLADLARRESDVRIAAEEADDSCEQTQAALDAFVSADTLDAGTRAAGVIARALRSDLGGAPERDRAAAAAVAASEALVAANGAVRQAEVDLEQARQSDAAGALRAHLHAGGQCPVCEQEVAVVPPSTATGHVTALTVSLVAAREVAADAERVKTEWDDKVRVAAAGRAAQLAQAEAARIELNTAFVTLREQMSDADAVGSAVFAPIDTTISDVTSTGELALVAERAEQALADLDAARQTRHSLSAAFAAADARRSAATKARRALESDSRAVDHDRTAGMTALQAARDAVHMYGAPPIDSSDLATSWQTLASWAASENANRVAQLGLLRNSHTSATKAAAEAQKQHTQAADTLTQARVQESRATQNAARTAGSRDDVHAQRDRLRATLTGQPDALAVADLLAELDKREAAAAEARLALNAARQNEEHAAAAAHAVQAAVSASGSDLAAVRDPLTRYGAPALRADGLAAAWNGLAQWASDTAHGVARVLAETRKTAASAESAYSAAAANISDAFTALGLPAPEPGATPATLRSTVAASAAEAAATARSEAAHAATRLAERERLADRHAMATESAQVAGSLATLLRSDGFRAWLLESALASLVHDASQILFEMSSGQFELKSAAKDLEVIDHNDADLTRPVRTLSGGETFQASLALALALSRQVATLAASGAAKLESIFLDEGFGTLDETSLDVVAGTLEALSSSGERMVGVVTHVAALADQIPVRFEVSRTGSSSTITRVNA